MEGPPLSRPELGYLLGEHNLAPSARRVLRGLSLPIYIRSGVGGDGGERHPEGSGSTAAAKGALLHAKDLSPYCLFADFTYLCMPYSVWSTLRYVPS